MRAAIGAVGVVIGLFGAWFLLTRQDLDQLTSAAVWLVAGVVLHDGLIATVTLVVAAVAPRLLPRASRAPAVVGLVVLGSVTLLAVPVLGRYGARPDNATLLDRDYTAGWLVLAGLTVVGVVVATLVRTRRATRRDPLP
jgi:hypothetical protein